MAKDFRKKIAFTDFEMTGLSPMKHEIIEIGLIVADTESLEEISRLDIKVKPQTIETADAYALKFTGYNEKDWEHAYTLKEALVKYSMEVEGALFAAWNTPYDWSFLVEAFAKAGLENPLDYHTLDVFTVAYEKISKQAHMPVPHLSKVCEYLGIPKEPIPHRAINGAEGAWQVYKKLRAL